MPIAELTSSLDLTHEDILYMETKTLFVQLLRVLSSSVAIARCRIALRRGLWGDGMCTA